MLTDPRRESQRQWCVAVCRPTVTVVLVLGFSYLSLMTMISHTASGEQEQTRVACNGKVDV